MAPRARSPAPGPLLRRRARRGRRRRRAHVRDLPTQTAIARRSPAPPDVSPQSGGASRRAAPRGRAAARLPRASSRPRGAGPAGRARRRSPREMARSARRARSRVPRGREGPGRPRRGRRCGVARARHGFVPRCAPDRRERGRAWCGRAVGWGSCAHGLEAGLDPVGEAGHLARGRPEQPLLDVGAEQRQQFMAQAAANACPALGESRVRPRVEEVGMARDE